MKLTIQEFYDQMNYKTWSDGGAEFCITIHFHDSAAVQYLLSCDDSRSPYIARTYGHAARINESYKYITVQDGIRWLYDKYCRDFHRFNPKPKPEITF